jgi:acyl-CoA thioester hydrolase
MDWNETKIKVRYVETDQMGIVYHSNYFPWFDVGRTELLEAAGLKYSKMEEMGILFPLMECGCTFKSSAKYQEYIIIRTKITFLSPARAEFKYEVIREVDGKLLAEGFTKHVFTNKQLKPINLQKKFPYIWEIFNK